MVHPLRSLLIGAIVLCASIQPALCASPRDALKKLPKFTHTSRFHTIDSDTPASKTRNETYTGSWAIDWEPPRANVGAAKIKYSLHYRLTLNDFVNRVENRTNDSRKDYYKVVLGIEGLDWFGAGITFEDTDDYNEDNQWASRQAAQYNFNWAPPGFPRLSMGHNQIYSTRLSNGVPSAASDFEVFNYSADYQNDNGAFAQKYAYTGQHQMTRNILNQANTDEKLSNFEGYRKFPLGAIGTLNLAYNYSEQTRSTSIEATPDTTTTNQYNLGLGSSVKGIPLKYNFQYVSNIKHTSAGSTSELNIRSFGLTYNPPVPEGKSLALAFSNELRDEEQPSRQNSVEKQRVAWNFRTNPLTSGSISYQIETNTDVLAKEVTSRRETTTGSLEYKIPGNRGNLVGNLSQDVQLQPQSGDRNPTDSFTFQNYLQLGDKANVNFYLTQIYSGNDRNLPVSSSDTLTSGVRYSINSGQGLSLNANWSQQLRVSAEDNKENTQRLGVTLNYNHPSNWRYDFTVVMGNTRDVARIQPGGSEYQSHNEIEAKVTYTF